MYYKQLEFLKLDGGINLIRNYSQRIVWMNGSDIIWQKLNMKIKKALFLVEILK